MMDDEITYLPGILHEIAEIVGRPAALAIMKARGGTAVYFPIKARPGHWLRELVGNEAAEKLCAHFQTTMRGGLRAEIPLGSKAHYLTRRNEAIKLLKGGLSVDEIALRLGVDRGTVKRWRRQERAVEQSRIEAGS